MENKSRDLKQCVLALIVGALGLGLSGCGGGGGGGGGPLSAAAESANNYGLAVINANAAYAKGGSGAGVTVAVIDTGIDTRHSDLDANIAPASIDIVVPSFPLQDDIGHGTNVAGIIAAERNGRGMHGVAFNSRILAIRADDPQTGLFFDVDLARAVDYAVANQARIINMSLGGTSASSAGFRQSQINATRAGVILVSPTGNAGASQPEFPAGNAGDPAFNGLALAVGAVDRNGNSLAGFSNRCGASRNFCLVAPGVDIFTTQPGGGYATVDGTSFAAPHVAGAAAVLLQLFPNLSPQDVVQILLDSATDLGAAGVDVVYGHGLLSFDDAVAPLGVLSVPLATTAAGQSAALGSTHLSLGPAFGDALSGNSVLARAVALDDFDRAYPVDLTAAVASADRGFGLETLLAASDRHSAVIPSPAGMTLQIAMAADRDIAPWHRSGWREPASGIEAASFAGALSPETEWRLGLGLSAGSQFGTDIAAASSGTLFLGIGELTNPHYALLGSGDGMRLDQSLSESTTLSLGLFESDAVETGDADLGWGGGNILQASLNHAFGQGAALRLDVARVEESDTFLGSQTDGAFGAGIGATSHFMTVSGGLPVTRDIDLIGSVTTATSEVSDAGLLSDWGTVQSTAFGFGVVAREVLEPGDRLGLLVGQPLRVSSARATLTVPVGITADEAVISDSRRVDLSPGGREMNLQLAYDRDLWSGAGLSSWLLVRTQPGHDRSAANDYGIGLSFRMAF